MSLLTKSISFCDKVGLNLIDDGYKARVVAELKALGADVFRRRHDRWDDARSAAKMRQHPFLACQMSSGNAYFCYLTRYNSKPACIFVDKKVQAGFATPRIILAPFRFAPSLHAGTVLDGEMVKTADDDWVFLVGDVLAVRGRSCAADATSLPGRLDILHNVFETQFTPSIMDVCAFQVKRYFLPADVGDLRALIDGLGYGTRGVLFRPAHGAHTDIFYELGTSRDKRGAERQQQTSAPTTTSAHPRPPPAPAAAPSPRPNKAFKMCQTGAVDCYKLTDASSGKAAGMLVVRGIKDSLRIQDAFRGQPISRQLAVWCEWDERFEKHAFVDFQPQNGPTPLNLVPPSTRHTSAM